MIIGCFGIVAFRTKSAGTSKVPPSNKATFEPAGLVPFLLRYAATSPAQRAGSIRAPAAAGTERQLEYATDAGLAPLLAYATRNDQDHVPAGWKERLLAADLTAQVRHGSLVDAALEVIDACGERAVPVTLLKGISISDQHYPAAHLRPMSDIDVLVAADEYDLVEAALLRRGFIRHPDYEQPEGAHHGIPLFHPRRHVWLEIHTALFPNGDPLVLNELFNPAQVASQSVAADFHGRPVRRLTNEMQLVYIASSWTRDLSRNAFDPSLIIPLFDAIYLLKSAGGSLDWDGMLGWIDNGQALASIYVMLEYLVHHDLDHSAAPVMSRLASMQDSMGPVERRAVCALIDTCLVRGAPRTRLFNAWHASIALNVLLAPGPVVIKSMVLPWNLLFPPEVPGRYRIGYQWGRLKRLLRPSA